MQHSSRLSFGRQRVVCHWRSDFTKGLSAVCGVVSKLKQRTQCRSKQATI